MHMGALVVPLRQLGGVARSALPLMLHGDPWAAATGDKRRAAEARARLLQMVQDTLEAHPGVSQATALKLLQADIGLAFAVAQDQGGEHAQVLVLAQQAGYVQRPNQAQALQADVVPMPTLKRHFAAFLKEGKQGALDGRKGKQRLPQEWHPMAAALYNRPSKPSCAGVAKELQANGYPGAATHLVRSYLRALPTRLGEAGPARIGPALHKLTLQKYQARTLDNLRPGDVYVGDGHTVDVYLAHPNTGKLWRPELSMFMDLKSRMPVGWWLGNSENTIDTLRALGSAMHAFDHVPPMLYLDHGPGYRAKLMADESVGFAAQMGIDLTAAHPGNPHGKGWIESYFNILRNEHDKFFAGGSFYCGDDMAPETNRRLSAELGKPGCKRRLPSLWDYTQSMLAFFARVANRPMEALDGAIPAEVWKADFVRIPTVLPVAELIRPMEVATVRRQMVTLHKRTYYHPALIDWQALKVRVRYDLHDDQHVWISDDKNQLICEATLTHKVQAIPSSRIEEARDVALRKSIERKQQHIDEDRARRAGTIDADSQFLAIEELAAPSPPPPLNLARSVTDINDIDLTTWRNTP